MYRLEVILGTGVTVEMFQTFLDGLCEVAPALRILGPLGGARLWRQEDRPGRAVTWWREFDPEAWAAQGTPLLLGLIQLAAEPQAVAWQAIGPGAAHPDCGLRLLLIRPAGPVQLFRLP